MVCLIIVLENYVFVSKKKRIKKIGKTYLIVVFFYSKNHNFQERKVFKNTMFKKLF